MLIILTYCNRSAITLWIEALEQKDQAKHLDPRFIQNGISGIAIPGQAAKAVRRGATTASRK